MSGTELAKRFRHANRHLGVSAVVVMLLSGVCPPCFGAARTEQPSNATRPDASTLCAFIAGKMQSEPSQVPTLCAPVRDTAVDPAALPGTLIVSVFSPTDVLEGKMRRAWSTALFQTAQALFFDGALSGACEASRCDLHVSDASVSEEGLYYSLDSLLCQTGLAKRFLGGNVASDDTYRWWWGFLIGGRKPRHPEYMSTGNAEMIAKDACKDFKDEVREENALPEVREENALPVPGCTLMLATNSKVYVALDFPDWVYSSTANYDWLLPDTFGRAFDGTAYDGDVILKSPWPDAGERGYWMFGLDNLEFLWEEVHAGVRSGVDAGAKVMLDRTPGLQERHYPLNPEMEVNGFSAVVTMAPVPGTSGVLLDLTNGSEWSVTNEDAAQCNLGVGTEAFVGLPDTEAAHHGKQGSLDISGKCHIPAVFVQGW
jgi:hypothetical protein